MTRMIQRTQKINQKMTESKFQMAVLHWEESNFLTMLANRIKKLIAML